METYVVVDYIASPLCPLQSRLQHIYHGQPFARVDFIPPLVTMDLAYSDWNNCDCHVTVAEVKAFW
jgi:hypothetical protein